MTTLTWKHAWRHGVTADQLLPRLDPMVLLSHTVAWINKTRLRRWLVWTQLAIHTWVVLSTWLAPQAAAATQVSAAAAIGWMNLQDEDGVAVSSYMFSTDHGSLWHPTNLPLSSILQSEFGIWLMVVSFGVWFVCWAMSFNWLNLFSASIVAVSNSLTQTISTPAIVGAAVAVGSVPVAWYFLRGHTSKAVAQLCMILVVAVLGGTVLGNPIGRIIGSDGLLAQGRDTGIAISTSISGQPTSDGTAMIEQLQRQLTTTFIRQPLQEWNFGAVVDNQSPACKAAWSSGQRSGEEDQVKDAIEDCGADASHAMKHVADNPSGSQIGTGALLILFSFLLLAFACYLGFRIILTAFQAIWAGFKVIIGFAITGFIPGAGQTALWNSFADMILCALAMTVFVVFLGGWSIILRSLLSSNDLSGAAGITVAGIAMIVAIVLLWRTRSTREQAAKKISANISAMGGSPTATTPVGPSALTHALSAAQTVTAVSQGSAVKKIRALTETNSIPADRDPTTSPAKPADRKRGVVRSLAPVAAQAAAAAATGGTSAAASAAARTAGKQAAAHAAGKAAHRATTPRTPTLEVPHTPPPAAPHDPTAPIPDLVSPGAHRHRNPAPQPHLPPATGTGYDDSPPAAPREPSPTPRTPSTTTTHVIPTAADDEPPHPDPTSTTTPPPPTPSPTPSTQTTTVMAAPAAPDPTPPPVTSPWQRRRATATADSQSQPPRPHLGPDHHVRQDS